MTQTNDAGGAGGAALPTFGDRIRTLLDHYFHGGPVTAQVTTSTDDKPFFPFGLDDLQYWIVKRKDGMVVKYRVVGPAAGEERPKLLTMGPPNPSVPTTHSLGGWCKHNPASEPVWVGDKFDLYIADAPGCRTYKEDFDFVLDCGDNITASYALRGNTDSTLVGDPTLVSALSKYATTLKSAVKVLKVDWDDRAAPPLKFEFWPALHKKLSGTVLTACQGGHGRSGTSLVCLMMVANPAYSPADAIIHLRAVHCPRAIESVMQHNYIGEFGVFLGRPNDIERVKGVKDFKQEFLTLTHESSKVYQERVVKEIGGVKG